MTSFVLVAYRSLHKAGLLLPYLKTQEAFERGVWNAVRAFYSDGEVSAFVDTMVYWITEQLGRAWREGARDMGVKPEEFEDEDNEALQAIIDNELNFVLDFAGAIETAREAGEGFAQFRSRASTWANRYTDIVNRARVHFGGREKLEWHLGATEQHCPSCAYLNGIVAWAREWEEAGVKPQSPPNDNLSCGGWKCDCSLLPTDKRKTRNALSRIQSAPKTEHVHQEEELTAAPGYFAAGVSPDEIKAVTEIVPDGE